MPFPIKEKYIKEAESKLNVKFLVEFKKRMIKWKGVELLFTNTYEFELHPYL